MGVYPTYSHRILGQPHLQRRKWSVIGLGAGASRLYLAKHLEDRRETPSSRTTRRTLVWEVLGSRLPPDSSPQIEARTHLFSLPDLFNITTLSTPPLRLPAEASIMQHSPASNTASQCAICSRTFARPDHLRRHELSHVSPKAKSCTVCHRKFTRMDGLQRHCRTVHPVEHAAEIGNRRTSSSAASSPTSPKRPRLNEAPPGALQHLNEERESNDFSDDAVQELGQEPEYFNFDNDDVLETTTRGTGDFGLAQAVAEAFPGLWPDVRDFLRSTTHDAPIDENGGTNHYDSNTLVLGHGAWSPPISTLCGLETDRPLDRPFPAFDFRASLDELLTPDRHVHPPSGPFGFEFHTWATSSPGLVRPNLSSPSVPRTFQNGTCSVDEILTNIDIASLLAAYKTHSYPNIPLLHLPTFRLFSADLSTSDLEDCISNPRFDASTAPFNTRNGRKMPRCLLYSIIALGAAYSLCPLLAQRFFEETGSEVRKYLRRSSYESSQMPPPDVSVIQAFIQYIQFCFCEGNQVLEQVAVQHICCLASLVQDAKLGKVNVAASTRASENAVNSDWHTWALFEERKRTYFCAYFVCSAGLTLINPAQPFIGHSHIELELPCREALWEAGTEKQWKALGIEAADVCPLQSTLSSLFPPKIVPPPETTIDLGALGSVERTFKMSIAMIAAHTEQGPAMEPLTNTASIKTDLISNVSEFGCLVLILALNESVWAWRKQQQDHERTSPQDAQQLKDFKHALDTWQAMWQRLPKSKENLTLGDKVLLGCLPIFDHTKLALQVDISLAKDALHSRNYQRTNAIFKSIFDGSIENDNSSLSPPNDNLATAEHAEAVRLRGLHPYTECREVAAYAISALRLSYEMAPWWSEGGEAFDIPVISAITAFHCTQIVCGWLSFVAATFEAYVRDFNAASGEEV
ncbi:uncharacterized protein BDZ99DRAFT_504290 [Mytilinidion resinicola]|uniref:C2H2-type domain-containing protein n=1 Tax=Mytilinidion resinicola TaxID=574789 RepID=A0A6A6Y1W2_9PEZI|nr:uncharacterized protein BDZ99DRAFT_504290 [Mytilinidion resinicola]KAF2801797.1 hypothetical protein BDZ99DRAFT_504290 [Mytilinidion resinicola]